MGKTKIKKLPKNNPSNRYKRLAESHLFLESIIENIPNMIFVKDAKHLRFIRLNKTGEKLLGYSKKKLIGKSDYDVFPIDEAEFFIANDRQVLKNKKLYDIPEEPIHTAKHGTRFLHTRKIPILGKNKKPIYLLGISEDITEKKKAEEHIKLYANLVDNIQVAFLVWKMQKKGDPRSLKLVGANPKASQLLKMNMNELLGRTMEELFPDFLETDIPKKYIQVIETGKLLDISDVRYGDDNVKLSDWSIKAFSLPDNSVGVLLDDVTEPKRVESEVLKSISREQHRIGQDLHDGLGQDLTAISFLLKGIEKGVKTGRPEIGEKFLLMEKMLNESIDKTRRLARGLHPVELESIGLHAALSDLVSTIEKLFPVKCVLMAEKNIETKDLDTANQIFRLAQEAVWNAAKHSKGTKIVVSLKSSSDGILLSIQDNGIGIKEKTARSNKGMGLHIMQYRARIIRGELTIKNKGGTLVQCRIKAR